MALNDNEGTVNVAPGSANQQQSQAAPQAQAQVQQPTRVGARNLNSLLGRPFSKSAMNETLQIIAKTYNEFLENEVDKTDPGFKVLVIDGKHSMTALSAIALCYMRQRAGQEYVSVHTMLVEGNTRLSNRTVQNNGQTIEVITVAGDVADNEMRKRVLMAVGEAYGRNVRIVEAAANIIFSELDVSDKHNLRTIFGNAIQACYQALVVERVIDEASFNASVIGGGDKLDAYLDLHPQKIYNSSGLPIRSDVSVQLQAVVQQSSQSQPEQVIGLTQVDGFVDLVYVPPTQQQVAQPMMGNFYQQATQRYCPRFVITNFNSIIDAATMELQLLALASSSILLESSGGVAPWMNTFKPRPPVKGVTDIKDIGAVGLEVNFTQDAKVTPMIIDTKSNGFQTQDLYKLLNTALYPTPIYSIDVEDVGDLSYLNLPLIIAADEHSEGYQRAVDMITNAANALTNNNFSANWAKLTGGSGEKYFLNDMNRIFTGYYINSEGERRDIRDIDYLAILNMVGRKDGSYIKEWSDTFDRKDIPMDIRLDKRRRIYESILPGQVTFKGYARRITINPKFMMALGQACKDSRLVFRPTNLNTEYYTGTEHGIANANTLYGMQSNNNGLFSFGNASAGNSNAGFNLPGFTGFGRNW